MAAKKKYDPSMGPPKMPSLLDMPDRPDKGEFTTRQELPGIPNPGPWPNPSDYPLTDAGTARYIADLQAHNTKFTAHIDSIGSPQVGKTFDQAGFDAAMARYEEVKNKRTGINDKRKGRYERQDRKHERYKTAEENKFRESLLEAANRKPDPAPTLSNDEANRAAEQQRLDAARRSGYRKSIIAGETGGYRNPATGASTLSSASLLA